MKHRRFMVALIVGCLLLLSGAYIGRMLYWQPQDRPWIRRLVMTVPFPVARVGKQYVRYADYLAQQDATRLFLRSSVARGEGLPTDVDAKVRGSILDQLIRVAAVRDMASGVDIRLRSGEVDRLYEDMLQRAGTSTQPGEVAAYLQSTFGWSEDVFKERVVRPAALETVVRQELYRNDVGAFETALKEKVERAVRYIRL